MVVVGAGFGGLSVVKGLRHAPVDVVLVEANNFHTFQPLLYQVATAGLGADDVAYAVRGIFRRQRNVEVQMDVMYDYRKNVPLYPEVQRLFREHQPPTLITWGERDTIFPADGAHPYKRDLKDLEFHLFPTGHFALEDKGDEIMPLIGDFLDRKLS